MILEGVVTTTNADGSTNVAPMGPIVGDDMARLLLRPFPNSVTYANLLRTGEGVFHVTDDVLLIAQAAVASPDPPPRLIEIPEVSVRVLADACRWYAIRVEAQDGSGERPRFDCRVVGWGRLRDFFGFCRAKHAVLEAAILASRIALLEADHLRRELDRCRVLVEKTGGDQERRAFRFLARYIEQQLNH